MSPSLGVRHSLLGASQGTWFFPMTWTEIDLDAYPPLWEWEVCFTPPAAPAPWNLYFNHSTNRDEVVADRTSSVSWSEDNGLTWSTP